MRIAGAVVVAAGLGDRLASDRPKALVPVAGRPMIEYVLLLLRHYGIREIIINLHHFGEQIEQHLGDGRQLGLEISYSIERELLGTGGGLLKAKPFLQDGTFIVINTDALIDLNLAELIAFHKEAGASATLVLRPDEEAERQCRRALGCERVVEQDRVEREPDRDAGEQVVARVPVEYAITEPPALALELADVALPEGTDGPVALELRSSEPASEASTSRRAASPCCPLATVTVSRACATPAPRSFTVGARRSSAAWRWTR